MRRADSTSRFIDPREMNSLPVRAFVEEITEEGVMIRSDFGTLYRIKGPHSYTHGEEGRIRIGFDRHFAFESLAEAEQKRLEAELFHIERRNAERARMERHRADTMAHNESISLPFKWIPVEFIRVRMLHERGMGCGTAKNSVGHILLLEDYAGGRLQRKRGDVLCGKAAKFEDDFSFHGEAICLEQRQTIKASCRECLKKAEKIRDPKREPQRDRS